MTGNSGAALTPAAAVGMLARLLPLGPLNHALGFAMRRLGHRHPAVIDRLAPIAGRRFLVVPDGLGVTFLIGIEARAVTAAASRDTGHSADIRIRGPLPLLIQMLEGKLDGDALFFARNLHIEGDTEALLTLRNAIDSEDIDLRQEVLSLLGPLSPVADRMADGGLRLWRRLTQPQARASRRPTL
ncbi:MAG: sterol-binding protein [Alphaproteobacteria bacterium]|nr:MAG: sterol-binding protein [Alphaproteobacteria bacterium]